MNFSREKLLLKIPGSKKRVVVDAMFRIDGYEVAKVSDSTQEGLFEGIRDALGYLRTGKPVGGKEHNIFYMARTIVSIPGLGDVGVGKKDLGSNPGGLDNAIEALRVNIIS